MKEVNTAFTQQSKLLEDFNNGMLEERTYIEAANFSKEGWATAEAMKKGTGVFSNADENSSKRMREAETLVRREKAASLKKNPFYKNSTRGSNNYRGNGGSYRRNRSSYPKNSLSSTGIKEIVDNLRKIGRDRSRSRSRERKYSPFRKREVKKEDSITCYKCWAKGKGL